MGEREKKMAPSASLSEEDEKKIFDCIAKNNLAELKLLLYNFQGDIFDEHGMTPLQHAAYKGNKEIVQLLLDQGADVNSGRHKHGYSTLHFAVLSGNAEVCRILLSAGAKSHATNGVGRTPSEMAAFVGNHLCVSVINNYIPRSEVDYYTIPQGFETEPKLAPTLAGAVHKFAMQVNMHPVRIALNLQPNLVGNLDPLRLVLTLMSSHEMRRKDTNEVMSFKLHYLASVVAEVAKCRQVDRQTPSDPVEAFARKVLRSVRGREYLEMFVRDCVREFPHRECTIFRQVCGTMGFLPGCGFLLNVMGRLGHLLPWLEDDHPETESQIIEVTDCIKMVTMLAKPEAPPALHIVCSMVCPRMFPDGEGTVCATCGEETTCKKCSKCKNIQYCDRTCQRLHWFVHKKECLRLSTNTTTTREESN